MNDQTALLYNNIFKVVHYTCQNPDDWNYLLCQRNKDGKYFVFAVPEGYTLKDKRLNIKKFLMNFSLERVSYEYGGSVMMNIIKKVDAYFTDDNFTMVWVREEESYDIHPMEIRDVESKVNSLEK